MEAMMQNQQGNRSKVTVIPIANSGFAGTHSIQPVASEEISKHSASVISIENLSRVSASEVVSNWKELHCKLTLDQVRIFTDLVRVVTVPLKDVNYRAVYQDVLEKIDSRLAKILSRYPGSEFNFDKKQPGKEEFRICNIGLIPVTDEGFDFIDSVYDLLENRADELKAEHERAKLELEALLPKDPLPPGNLYHLAIRYTPGKKRGRYGRYDVWAKNEAAAEEKALVKFHKEFPVVRAENLPFNILEIEILERGSWSWNWYFQREGGKCE
jgi:hypothetical protein